MQNSGIKWRYYEENGKSENELIFASKPAISDFQFELIHSDNIGFYQQLPLTEEEIKQGNIRPENVIYSYACFIHNKLNNKYRTGKVCHIFRPKVIDARGQERWCEFNIEKGLMTIGIDFTDLVFPVILDPTFGWETVGGSSSTLSNQIKAGTFTNTSGAGTVTAISADMVNFTSGKTAKCAIFDQEDSDAFVGGTDEITDGDEGFNDYTASGSYSVVDNHTYHLAAWADGYTLLRYDSGITGADGEFDAETYGAWPNPPSFLNLNEYRFAIHCDFTEAGGEEAIINIPKIENYLRQRMN